MLVVKLISKIAARRGHVELRLREGRAQMTR
jgi:hypothetical protein